MVPTLTPYLAEYFKINNHREMFGKSNLDVVNNLIAQSHEASTTEVNLAKQGKILTTLHSGPFQSTTFNGNLQNELHTTPARDGWGVHR